MILERETELAELDHLVDETASSGGRVVLVRGEAGIGKSTVINRFLSDSQDRAHTLLGACDDLLTPQPPWTGLGGTLRARSRPSHGR